jgi:hypothetical protein
VRKHEPNVAIELGIAVPGAMMQQQLPTRIAAAALAVQALVDRVDLAAAQGRGMPSPTAELAVAAGQLGTSYRESGLGPEQALVHLRCLLTRTEDHRVLRARTKWWLDSSLGWILAGYYEARSPGAASREPELHERRKAPPKRFVED